ncbi:MAG: ATP-dependent DNA helicase RecG [Prevotellaceae bacterium]|nr:ATP-dependent DNA helicase RecG [Prevotellaceae bacterium]
MLDTEIQFLPGVGPKRAELLQKELGVFTFGDLLYTFPFRYVDKSRIYTVKELQQYTEELPYVQLRGKITGFKAITAQQKRLTAIFSDETGNIELVWFKGLSYVQKNIQLNTPYFVFGKPTLFNGKLNIVHPEIESTLKETDKITSSIQAIYSSTERLKNSFLANKAFNKLQSQALSMTLPYIQETMPAYLVAEHKLLGLREALLNIHFPQSTLLLQQAEQRLKFEELLCIELSVLRQRTKRIIANNGFYFSKIGNHFNTFYNNNLPFELTNAQKRVIKEIRANMGSGKQMNRLLQGDVGSGKTMVALMCALIAADNEFQSCIMAPTEILATQHFNSVAQMLNGMNFKVALLTGSTKKSERNELFAQLQSGEIDLLIGTHALIEDTVQFENLGLVIIDEQHRFGVEQRGKLWEKNEHPPHILVMTATPIPRTLAMTVYGDLDVSVIDELPPGRKPIKTVHYTDSKRGIVFDFMRGQIAKGRQVYVVYPLIQESEKMDYKNLEEGYGIISDNFPLPKYKVCIVHGKLKNDVKDAEMQKFVRGEANIMVATSVIEVGVNVPNASVMVIESTERFGLAQLHQLRGRVGRGADQSFCILMSGVKLSSDGRKRINMMCSTNNGFEIAEADLQLRGHGDLEGTRQSGLAIDLKIASLSKDQRILENARHVAAKILVDDPFLTSDKNALLAKMLARPKHETKDYSVIS